MKQVTINERGVFVQETQQLTAYGIIKKRKLTQNQILSLRRKIQDAQISIADMERQIKNLEEQLKTLNSPLVEAFLERDKKEKQEVQEKAQAILRELIGDTLFQELQLKKRIVFQAKDGMVYKIEINGRIYRKVGKEWQQLCIIRPRDLPLPDFLLSLFVSIRENPTKYHLRRR